MISSGFNTHLLILCTWICRFLVFQTSAKHIETIPPNSGHMINVTTNNGNLWLNFRGPTNHTYHLRVGTGGAIGNITTNYNVQLIAGSYRNEHTDRIGQWVWWSNSLRYPPNTTKENRFNVNQGGDGLSHYTPSWRVDTFTNGVDVYSAPTTNWQQLLQNYFSGGFMCATRYRVIGPGIVSMRRIILVNKIYLNGVEKPLGSSYVEAWTPVSALVYDGMALSLDKNNKPNWWYKYRQDIPKYPHFPVEELKGYVLAFQTANEASGEVFGLLFGNKTTADLTYVLNSMDWAGKGPGIGLLPGVLSSDIEVGDILDLNFLIVLGRGLGDEFMNAVDQYKGQVVPPMVWKAGATLDPDLEKIRQELTSRRQMATDMLGMFVA